MGINFQSVIFFIKNSIKNIFDNKKNRTFVGNF
jgi:hypothetical protein